MTITSTTPRVTSIPSTIAAVEKSIAAIGNKVPGMPISATNFNTLTEAIRQLLSIARLQDGGMRTMLEAQFALKDHEHSSAVTVNWLDGDLRTRIGDGALALRELVSGLQGGVQSLNDELDRLRRTSALLQRSVDQYSVNDADRTASLRTLEQRITTLSESIRSLGTIKDDVALIKGKFDFLQSVLDTLTVDGKPISIRELRNQVLAHEALLENLNDLEGNPIRLVTLQQKLRELETISGLGEGLEQRLAAISALIETNLGAKFTGQLEAAIAAARTAINSSLAELSSRLDVNVAAVAAVDRRVTDLGTAVDRRFGELPAGDGNAAAIAAVGKRLTDLIAAIDQRLKELLDREIPVLVDQRITEELQRFGTTQNANIAAEVKKQLDEKLVAIREEISAAVKSGNDNVRQDVNKAIDDARKGLLVEVTRLIARRP